MTISRLWFAKIRMFSCSSTRTLIEYVPVMIQSKHSNNICQFASDLRGNHVHGGTNAAQRLRDAATFYIYKVLPGVRHSHILTKVHMRHGRKGFSTLYMLM